MSGSDPVLGSFRVQAARPFDELTITDGTFRPVATGSGSLAVELAAGIYEVSCRAGPVTTRRLVTLAAGERRDIVLEAVAFPATPPITGSAADDPGHVELVRSVTTAAGGPMAAAGTALVVVVRRKGPGGAVPDDVGLDLVDGRMRHVPAFDAGWMRSADARAAARLVPLAPGGYALAVGAGERAIHRSLWLAPGWTTVVFLWLGDRGLEPSTASVHMVPLGSAWTGGLEAAATELALWGLREDHWQAGPGLLDAGDRGLVPAGPMLDLAVAHLLLAAPLPDPGRVAGIVARLAASLPGHPDVVALQLALAERGVASPEPVPIPVSWPPMLLASYRTLLRRDALAGDALVPGSVAERAAAVVGAQGIWTGWAPMAPTDHVPPKVARTSVAPGKVLQRVARHPDKVRRPKTSDPATRRVAAYLDQVAELEPGGYRAGVAGLTPSDIALATGLPMATVDRSLRRIWLTFAGFSVMPLVITLATLGAATLATVSLLLLGSGVSGPVGSFPPVGSQPPFTTPSAQPATVSPESRPPDTEPPVDLPIVVAPALELGSVPLDELTRSELPVENAGAADLNIEDVWIDGDPAGEFGVDPGGCLDGPVPPGSACTLLVTFGPAEPGRRSAELVIVTTEVGEVRTPVAGIGLQPDLPPGEVRFEPDAVELNAQETVDIRVVATGPLGIVDVLLAGLEPDSFEVASRCTGVALDAGQSCPVRVTYLPRSEGSHSTELVVRTEDGSEWRMPIEGRLVIF